MPNRNKQVDRLGLIFLCVLVIGIVSVLLGEGKVEEKRPIVEASQVVSVEYEYEIEIGTFVFAVTIEEFNRMDREELQSLLIFVDHVAIIITSFSSIDENRVAEHLLVVVKRLGLERYLREKP